MIRRREFISLLGGAVACPLAARAQQRAMPVIGFLRSTSLAVSAPMVTGFRQGLTVAGFTEGQNAVIEYRYADNQRERLPGLVAELIRHDGADRIRDRHFSSLLVEGARCRHPRPLAHLARQLSILPSDSHTSGPAARTRRYRRRWQH